MEDLRKLGESLGTKEATCEQHGTYTSAGHRWLGKIVVWSGCKQCEAVKRQRDAELEREKAAAEQRRMVEEALDAACIPRRFIGRTFDVFDAPTAEMQRVRRVAVAYADEFERHLKDGTGLIFGGTPGTGKSHLAIAVLQAILPKHVGLYSTCAGIIRAVRSTWGGKSERTESEIMATLAGVPLLVLDEVGVQMGTDNEQHIIFGVLDARYRDMLPTIILTNQDTEGLKKYLGERSYDRLRETSAWVQFTWDSYRGTNHAHQ